MYWICHYCFIASRCKTCFYYLSKLNVVQVKYLHPRSTQKNRYYKADKYEVLNEVHVYPAISDSAISKLDINQKNVKASRNSYIVGGLILAGAILAIAAVVGGAAL